MWGYVSRNNRRTRMLATLLFLLIVLIVLHFFLFFFFEGHHLNYFLSFVLILYFCIFISDYLGWTINKYWWSHNFVFYCWTKERIEIKKLRLFISYGVNELVELNNDWLILKHISIYENIFLRMKIIYVIELWKIERLA